MVVESDVVAGFPGGVHGVDFVSDFHEPVFVGVLLVMGADLVVDTEGGQSKGCKGD